MNYTLHQLKVFLKVSKTRSITKAAEELNLSQPAVSIQLKNLQDQFEIPLTEVIGRQLYITDFGKEIAIAVEQIVNEVNKINYKSLAYKGIMSGVLKISVVSTGKYVMPFYLSDFMNANKGIELEMDVTNKTKVITALKNNEIDFALVSSIPDDINLEFESLMENKLFLVGGKQIRYSDEFKMKTLLQDIPLIFREEGSATRLYMEEYIKNKGLVVKSKLQLTSNEAVKQAVISGLGVSIMPLIGLKNELERGDIKIIQFEDLPMISNWKLIWLKDKKMSPVAQAYLTYLQAEKLRINESVFSWINNY
ncbi:LysR family transcriptional regulator [Flavobacterium ammonificans]|jgi:DNA-binding transcriptional LysR family regulator|uniref:Transcriptional regulator n=1 Tax=Flavobacterium ammonificans TaxID=1751056 RepID=A0ABN6KVL2_9FLAO|nr:LysR family transcriptional regulator [Flavobacterium ammonificans]BDB52974.1 transcriptional regulator [Flavobacterium ammonificans]BDB57044.1 transcriptional regulator [Flavobacterium ammonificans]